MNIIAQKDIPWQIALKQAIKDPYQLLHLLKLSPEQVMLDPDAAKTFALRVPQPYIDRMKCGDPNDPLLRQVLPTVLETKSVDQYLTDPLAESRSTPAPGIIHKYHGRVLLVVSAACAIHCRYCFRRHFPYQEHRLGGPLLDQAVDYIRRHSDISEVIFSGGDPLVANDHSLEELVRALDTIPHLTRLRIHTRLPVVIPNRIDSPLLNWLTKTRLTTTMVLHINHYQELDQTLVAACRLLKQQHILLLNQSVLLKGINDNVQSLVCLSEALFEAGILPYYLHCLDKVAGAAHFDIDRAKAQYLYGQMMQQLPGYLVPRLVEEQPQWRSKKPILPDFAPLKQ